MPKNGLFARVLNGGEIHTGDTVEYMPYNFTINIITLSDRAFGGVYQDLSGPKANEILGEFFKGSRWKPAYSLQILPDEADKLEKALLNAEANNVDIVFTTGSTGLGPRDIAPDVVQKIVHKQIPGIMEHIRCKYGTQKPNALLSRSIAGIMGKTLIFTLPGSTKAVAEYLKEIMRILEHSILMIHGIGH
jgi:molybdenum cofactor synthesis domain-containing protein